MSKHLTTPHKSERKEALIRLFVALFCGAIGYVWSLLVGVLVILNWLSALLLGRRNGAIGDFVELYNSFVYTYLRYISGVSNVRPFPFTTLERLSKFA